MKDEQRERAKRILRLVQRLSIREIKLVEAGARALIRRRIAALREDDPAAVEQLRKEARGWSDEFLDGMEEVAAPEAWQPTARLFLDVVTEERERRAGR